jgi:antitoxin CptB
MDGEFGKLRWRCRRGMKELDLLLTRFVDEQYAAAPPAERLAFHRLLDLQDPLIYDYLVGRQAPADAVLCALIGRMTGAPPNGR